MSLTFVVGGASDVFPDDLARQIGAGLLAYGPEVAGGEPYESEPVDAWGWRQLQERVMRTLENAPQITTVEAYQAVFVPAGVEGVEHRVVGSLADPLQIGSLPSLLDELRRFAAAASLPTDDLELMKLAAHYLENDDPRADLDVQTYVQLMLSAKQAAARRQPLWIVV